MSQLKNINGALFVFWVIFGLLNFFSFQPDISFSLFWRESKLASRFLDFDTLQGGESINQVGKTKKNALYKRCIILLYGKEDEFCNRDKNIYYGLEANLCISQKIGGKNLKVIALFLNLPYKQRIGKLISNCLYCSLCNQVARNKRVTHLNLKKFCFANFIRLEKNFSFMLVFGYLC